MHDYSTFFTYEYISFSFVSLDRYSSLITKGSFPYSPKQQEVPVACHPPVKNSNPTDQWFLYSTCYTASKILYKTVVTNNRKKCKLAIEKRRVKRVLKVTVRTTEQTAVESAPFFWQTF